MYLSLLGSFNNLITEGNRTSIDSSSEKKGIEIISQNDNVGFITF
jgi:hypothetical protein